MEGFLIKGAEHEGWPYLVLAGDGARELAMQVVEYVASLEFNPTHPKHLAKEIEPMQPEVWLAEHAGDEHCDLAVVAVLGPVSAGDENQLERLCAGVGDRCIKMIDTETDFGPHWQSVIRVPCRSESCWAECMQILLSILLLSTADRGRIAIPVDDIQPLLRGHRGYLVRAKGCEGAKEIVAGLLRLLAQHEDHTTFDTLIVTAPGRASVKVSEIARIWSDCMEALPNLLDMYFLPGYEDDDRLAIGLIAGIRIASGQKETFK